MQASGVCFSLATAIVADELTPRSEAWHTLGTIKIIL